MIFFCLVLPGLYVLTSNRKRKTYEEIIGTIIELAGRRKKILAVHTIVSDFEDSWLRAVENMVVICFNIILKYFIDIFSFKRLLSIHIVAERESSWVLVPLHPSLLPKHQKVRIIWFI
jgi:hypothetical protein